MQKSFVPSNTACDNEWAINNFASWRSQVGVEESFPHVLLADDKKLLCSFLRKYVSSTACCNKWTLNDFGWWTSRVAVEEFFGRCYTDWWSKTTLFLPCKYVSNTARCNKLSLNDFVSWRSWVFVKEFFSRWGLLRDNQKLLRSCLWALWKWRKRMDGCIPRWVSRNRLQVFYRSMVVHYTIADLRLVGSLYTWTIDLPSCTDFPMMTSLPYDM